MHSRLLKIVVGAGTLMAAALPVAAHHSFSAEFDGTKKSRSTGKWSRWNG